MESVISLATARFHFSIIHNRQLGSKCFNFIFFRINGDRVYVGGSEWAF